MREGRAPWQPVLFLPRVLGLAALLLIGDAHALPPAAKEAGPSLTVDAAKWVTRDSAQVETQGPLAGSLRLHTDCKDQGEALQRLPELVHGEIWELRLTLRTDGEICALLAFEAAEPGTQWVPFNRGQSHPLRVFDLGRAKVKALKTPVAHSGSNPLIRQGTLIRRIPISLAAGEVPLLRIWTAGGFGCAGTMFIDQIALVRVGQTRCEQPVRPLARGPERPKLQMRDFLPIRPQGSEGLRCLPPLPKEPEPTSASFPR